MFRHNTKVPLPKRVRSSEKFSSEGAAPSHRALEFVSSPGGSSYRKHSANLKRGAKALSNTAPFVPLLRAPRAGVTAESGATAASQASWDHSCTKPFMESKSAVLSQIWLQLRLHLWLGAAYASARRPNWARAERGLTPRCLKYAIRIGPHGVPSSLPENYASLLKCSLKIWNTPLSLPAQLLPNCGSWCSCSRCRCCRETRREWDPCRMCCAD